MTSVVESNGVSNDVFEVDSAGGTLKSPRAAALSTMGFWQRPRSSTRVNTSGSHFDSNLYVVAKVPTGPPPILPTNTSSSVSRCTPLGVDLVVPTFVYKQP
jgi:hypothetical protein